MILKKIDESAIDQSGKHAVVMLAGLVICASLVRELG